MGNSDFEYDVFLSFASLNERLARPLWEKLQVSGLRVFWSDEALKQKVGQSWYKVVEQSLEQSKHLVLLWSPEAKQSRFVQKEYSTFDAEFLHPPDRLLVPVLMPGVQVRSLPLFLRQLQSFRLESSVGDLIQLLGGRYEPLEIENARLREALEAATKEIEQLKKRKGKAASIEKVQAELKTLKKQYTEIENRLADREEVVGNLEAKNKSLLQENKAKVQQIGSLEAEVLQLKGKSQSKVKPPKKEFTDKLGIEYVLIKPGKFNMGEGTSVRTVTLTKPFYLGKYPVTQQLWVTVMGENPSGFKGDRNPVEGVSWHDVQQFIEKINKKEGCSDCCRLPTEAEWEYACRAGTTSVYSFGDDAKQLDQYAWYAKNAGGETHPVGEKQPNPWGLYDMHGNIWEWVSDLYSAYSENAQIDPKGPDSGSRRVVRGGGWFDSARRARSANRNDWRPGDRFGDVGFRVLRTYP